MEVQYIVVITQTTVVISIANKKGNAVQLNATNEVREQMEKTDIKDHTRKDQDSTAQRYCEGSIIFLTLCSV
jgi:hypothetical protein